MFKLVALARCVEIGQSRRCGFESQSETQNILVAVAMHPDATTTVAT